MAEKIKAYAVQDKYGDAGAVIVFDVRAVSARRDGAGQLDCEFGDVSCRRARWADNYAPGPVPPKVAIEEGGWRYECASSCGEWVDDETEKPFYDQHGQPWCSQSCHDSTKAHDAKIKAEREAAEEACRAATMDRFPFAEITYIARSGSPGYKYRAHFKFPGGKFDASWCPDDPGRVCVARADVEAWQALQAGGP